MGAAITPTSAIETFNQGHTAFVQRLEAAPDQALSYLKPGDDYSLGGIVHHVNAVLEHYLGVLNAIRESGYAPTEPRDRPGLMEEANQRAKHGLDRLQLTAALASTAHLHGQVSAHLAALPEADFGRSAPVVYASGSEPSPTSAADVTGWLTGHYEEHVPQIEALTSDWKTAH